MPATESRSGRQGPVHEIERIDDGGLERSTQHLELMGVCGCGGVMVVVPSSGCFGVRCVRVSG